MGFRKGLHLVSVYFTLYTFRKPETDDDESDDDEAYDLLDKNIEAFKLFGIFVGCLAITLIGSFVATNNEYIKELSQDSVSMAFRSIMTLMVFLSFSAITLWRKEVDR